MSTATTFSQSIENNTSDTFVGGILHVHPSLQCNLTCKHCYSSSSPRMKNQLNSSDIITVMNTAVNFGYTVLSVSGGEPFLYKELPNILQHAKHLGMKTQLVSNGILVESKIAQESFAHLDLVAISLDGLEEQHDLIRGKKGAFAKALFGAEKIANLGIKLGIVSAIANESWKSMFEIAKIAFGLKASLLQFHPLEISGRAVQELPHGLSEEDLHKAYIIASILQQQYADTMTVQMDCYHHSVLSQNPEICGIYEDSNLRKERMYKIVQSLIVDEMGNIIPFSYGLDSEFHIGNCQNKSEDLLTNMLENYLRNDVQNYKNLLNRCYDEALHKKKNDLIVWTDFVVKQSKKHARQLVK